MPCRRLPAASSTQCLWITDDVLSEAFNRFLRVSSAHIYHAKRFRSNAPGPLEARRRATRRRMGVAAVASGSASPPFDMGALFGLGVKPGADLEKEMRWKGPQFPQTRTNDDHWSELWMPQRRSHDQDERIAKFLDIPQDPVEESKEGFEVLLTAVSENTTVECTDIVTLLAYLQGPENEPEARLTARLLGWLHARSASDECFSALVGVVKQKIALGTLLEAETDDVVRDLRDHDNASEHVIEIAEALPRDWAIRILYGITRDLLGSSEDQARLEHLKAWLACLCSCNNLKGFRHPTSGGWNAVHAEISKYYQPSDLANYFMDMHPRRAAMVLLHTWVPKLPQDAAVNPFGIMDAKITKRLRYNPPPVREVDLPRLAEELKQLHGQPRSRMHWSSPLIDLVQILAAHRMPYHAILVEIISMHSQVRPAPSVRTIVMDLIRRPSVDIPTALATSMIQSFMASDDLNHAFQIFKAVPTVPLSACYDLPLQLIAQKKTHGEKIFIMLNRLVQDDTIPPSERSAHTLSLSQAHIDTVHLIAYAYARSPHISCRLALRRVWECYRFLRDRQAPLDPLLSRALVKAGISRPLSEGQRPSATQTAYILSIVERLEGLELAQNLDRLVFHMGKKIAKGNVPHLSPNFSRAAETREYADGVVFNNVRWRLWSWKRRGWFTHRIRAGKRYRQGTGVKASNGELFESGLPVPTGSAEDTILTPEHADAADQDKNWSMAYTPFSYEEERLTDAQRPPPPNVTYAETFTEHEIQQASHTEIAALPSRPDLGQRDVTPPPIDRTSRFRPFHRGDPFAVPAKTVQEPQFGSVELIEDDHLAPMDSLTCTTGDLKGSRTTPALAIERTPNLAEEKELPPLGDNAQAWNDGSVGILGSADESSTSALRSIDFGGKHHSQSREVGAAETNSHVIKDDTPANHCDNHLRKTVTALPFKDAPENATTQLYRSYHSTHRTAAPPLCFLTDAATTRQSQPRTYAVTRPSFLVDSATAQNHLPSVQAPSVQARVRYVFADVELGMVGVHESLESMERQMSRSEARFLNGKDFGERERRWQAEDCQGEREVVKGPINTTMVNKQEMDCAESPTKATMPSEPAQDTFPETHGKPQVLGTLQGTLSGRHQRWAKHLAHKRRQRQE